MFRLDDNEETIIKGWPVIISRPMDGGKVQTNEVAVDYLMLPQDELDELIDSIKDDDGSTDAEICRRVVRHVANVSNEDGKIIDYTPALLERLINRSYVRKALVSTYFDVVSGRKAKRKN